MKNAVSSSWNMYVSVCVDLRLTVWIDARVGLISRVLTLCSRTHTHTH